MLDYFMPEEFLFWMPDYFMPEEFLFWMLDYFMPEEYQVMTDCNPKAPYTKTTTKHVNLKPIEGSGILP